MYINIYIYIIYIYTAQHMLEAMNLVLFEDALMHLPGDPKNYSFAEFVGELEVVELDFFGYSVTLKCGIRACQAT